MSLFEDTPLAPSDAIFGLVNAFQADKRPQKLSFLVGFYRSEAGITPLMQAVQQAEKQVVEKELNKEYLPIEGDAKYLEEIGHLIFGNFWKKEKNRFIAAQAVGGTGALRLIGDFCYQAIGKQIWLSEPTWPNHPGIFRRAGFTLHFYPYYNYKTGKLEFDQLIHSLGKIPEKAIVLLQASCHNPSGIDLQLEQWQALSRLFAKKQLFPLFDVAYQGLAEGLEEDAKGLRLFVQDGHEMAIAYSCSKNFSLYSERVGALFFLAQSTKWAENVLSQIRLLIRTSYSNPPKLGAAIVKEILTTPQLKRVWCEELSSMRLRIEKMRADFCHALQREIPSIDWSFLYGTRGLFGSTALSKKTIEQLVVDFGIYMPSDGRINFTTLNTSNLNYVVNAIASCLQG